MNILRDKQFVNRRNFLKLAGKGLVFSALHPFQPILQAEMPARSDLFWIKEIPHHPFVGKLGVNGHAGVDCLLHVMGEKGLKWFRSNRLTLLSGPLGMIGPEDVVLVKVNAQWKYRGCTNSDLVRGLIQRILDHPDGFTGEVVIIENGQGRGSLNCDTRGGYPDDSVHANAENESHSFLYLVDNVFNDPRVSSYLMDPIKSIFIDNSDHTTDGYRIYQDVSYPCFTTSGGRRVELREGVWNGEGYDDKIKLINIPVLKHHDINGSEITASLKHFYGVLSMGDGHSKYRHYAGLGRTCGKMVASIKSPVLNILDCIWVSHRSLRGYPSDTTVRVDQILASQDPVALDYWAAKYIFYPIDRNVRHHPEYPGIDYWLSEARDTINTRGDLYNPEHGIFITKTTKNEQEMNIHERSTAKFLKQKIDEKIQEARKKKAKVIK